jgi:hypothetical protein
MEDIHHPTILLMHLCELLVFLGFSSKTFCRLRIVSLAAATFRGWHSPMTMC